MAVFKVQKNNNYTTLANYHFRDKNLSWKAKGILSNMMSLPEDWDYSLAGLALLSSDGMSSTRSAIKELEEHGYLIRRPIRKDGKISDWEYLIFEKPQLAKEDVENLLVENQQVENQTQLNTKELNTKELNTNKSNTKESITNKKNKSSDSVLFEKIIDTYSKGDPEIKELLNEWIKNRKLKRAVMTEKALKMNLDKIDTLAAESNMSVKEYLKEVICRGWQAFYPIKNYESKKNIQTKQRYGNFDILEVFEKALKRSYQDIESERDDGN